jgi:hypothetical protein
VRNGKLDGKHMAEFAFKMADNCFATNANKDFNENPDEDVPLIITSELERPVHIIFLKLKKSCSFIQIV